MTRTERKYLAAWRRHEAAWRVLRRVKTVPLDNPSADAMLHELRVANRRRIRTQSRLHVLHVRLTRIERRAR